jgi:hypothetical protein
MRLLGLLLNLSYRLSQHRIMGVRMDLLGMGAGLVAAVICFRLRQWGWAALLLALILGSGTLFVVAQRSGYVLFRPDPRAKPERPLRPPPPDSELPVRATGHFAIRDQIRYLAEHRAVLTTPRSREHILMACLQRSRFLLVGQSHASNWGWWYQFIRPEALTGVELGVIVHGWQPRRALRVSYRSTDSKGNQRLAETILSFEDEQGRAVAWADLTQELRARATTG